MKRRARPTPIPARMTTGRYFSALVRRHNWPPMFVSQIDIEDQRAAERSRQSSAQRDESARTGRGWANGTMDLPGTTWRAPPGRMARPGT